MAATRADIEFDGQPLSDGDDLEAIFAGSDAHDLDGNRLGQPGSPLRSLAAIRQQAQQTPEVKRLKVPGYDVDGMPPLYVRYRKVSDQVYDRILGQAARDIVRKPGKGSSDAYADWLAECCDGIYLLDSGADVTNLDDPHDGRELCPDPDDPHGELPRFDRRLRAMLGMPPGATVRATVRGLFYATAADGSVVFGDPGALGRHGDEIARWMGFAGEEDTDSPSLTDRRARAAELHKQLRDNQAVRVAAVAASRGFGDLMDLLALSPVDFGTVAAALDALADEEAQARNRAKTGKG